MLSIFFSHAKYFLFPLLLIGTNHLYSATTIVFKDPQADQVFITLTGTSISMNLIDYIQLKPLDFKTLTGHKLTFKETIALKITQKRIKKTIRKDGTVDVLAFDKQAKEPFKWHWGGFFLGLLLPILGMVIAAFIKDDQRKNRTTSACIGTLIACIAFIIFVGSSF